MHRHDRATVARWLERILGHEGGYSDNPTDPGNWTGGEVGEGELKGTKWGIAANTYGNLNIRDLTAEDAAEIYIRDYLAPLHAHRFEDGVAFQLLDFAVNSGAWRALKRFQMAVDAVPDGIIGPKTLEAMNLHSESDIIMRVLAQRIRFLTRQPDSWWDEFGRGLMNRIANNLEYGAEDS